MNKLINVTKYSLYILVLIHFTGCVSATQVMTPNGNMGYSIECNGTARNMTSCYKKAANVCPKGYFILNQENRTGFVANQYYVGATSNKGIFIECK